MNNNPIGCGAFLILRDYLAESVSWLPHGAILAGSPISRPSQDLADLETSYGTSDLENTNSIDGRTNFAQPYVLFFSKPSFGPQDAKSGFERVVSVCFPS